MKQRNELAKGRKVQMYNSMPFAASEHKASRTNEKGEMSSLDLNPFKKLDVKNLKKNVFIKLPIHSTF